MTNRVRRTAAQIAADLRARANVAEAKAKKVERAQQTRTAIIAGETIRAMAAAGHVNAKLVWDEMLAGLKRKQDRLAFGLEPLPEPRPDDQQPVNPPPGPDLSAAEARIARAISAWTENSEIPNGNMEPFRIEMRDSFVEFERLSGSFFSGLKAVDRRSYGLSDQPGVLLDAVRAS